MMTWLVYRDPALQDAEAVQSNMRFKIFLTAVKIIKSIASDRDQQKIIFFCVQK